jgi:hypothetical protein
MSISGEQSILQSEVTGTSDDASKGQTRRL